MRPPEGGLWLGRLVEHDERSRGFPAPTASSVVSKTWTHYGPALDQGQRSSCTGNAAAQAMNARPFRVGRRPLLVEADAVRLYGRATVLDGFPGEFPPDDTGSSGLAVAKALREEGRISAFGHAFGLDHALAATMLSPTLWGVPWYEAMFNPDSKGYVRADGAEVGGHEIVCVALSVERRDLTFVNSWGPAWGVRGRFRMTWDTATTLLARQGDVTSLVV